MTAFLKLTLATLIGASAALLIALATYGDSSSARAQGSDQLEIEPHANSFTLSPQAPERMLTIYALERDLPARAEQDEQARALRAALARLHPSQQWQITQRQRVELSGPTQLALNGQWHIHPSQHSAEGLTLTIRHASQRAPIKLNLTSARPFFIKVGERDIIALQLEDMQRPLPVVGRDDNALSSSYLRLSRGVGQALNLTRAALYVDL